MVCLCHCSLYSALWWLQKVRERRSAWESLRILWGSSTLCCYITALLWSWQTNRTGRVKSQSKYYDSNCCQVAYLFWLPRKTTVNWFIVKGSLWSNVFMSGFRFVCLWRTYTCRRVYMQVSNMHFKMHSTCLLELKHTHNAFWWATLNVNRNCLFTRDLWALDFICWWL